jgi:hypothetical protein
MTDADRVRRAVESGEFWGDVGTLASLLVDALKAARAETDLACAVFSKYQWSGRLGLLFEFHVHRGRRMAGLPADPAALTATGTITTPTGDDRP